MPKAGEIRYCPELGGQETNAAFVWIPPGSFWMGDKNNANNPVRFVVISKGFWMQQNPLTQEQYGSEETRFPEVNFSWRDVAYWRDNGRYWESSPSGVSIRLFRMPTEAEWEYAARANTGHKYLWSGSNVAADVAWTAHNSDLIAHEIRQLKSNNIGIFDMSGNVWEWCSDWYDNSVLPIPQIDPVGPAKGHNRISRGGAYFSDLESTQVDSRERYRDDLRHFGLGVRLIWEPQDA